MKRFTPALAKSISDLLADALIFEAPIFEPIPQPEVAHLSDELGLELFNLTVRLAEFDAQVAAYRSNA